MSWHDTISKPITYTIIILVILIVITYDYRNSTFVTAIVKAALLAPSYYFAAAAFVLVVGRYLQKRRREHLRRPTRDTPYYQPAPRQQDLLTPIDQPSNAFSTYRTPPVPQGRFVTLADLEQGNRHAWAKTVPCAVQRQSLGWPFHKLETNQPTIHGRPSLSHFALIASTATNIARTITWEEEGVQVAEKRSTNTRQ